MKENKGRKSAKPKSPAIGAKAEEKPAAKTKQVQASKPAAERVPLAVEKPVAKKKAIAEAKPQMPASKAKTPEPTPESAPAPAKKKASASKKKVSKLQVPPILLEGDGAQPSVPSGPGQRYSLGPTSGTTLGATGGGELPESYGTEKLFLTARDPRWLYASWDLSADQQRKYNSLAADRHLVLRVFESQGPMVTEIHVHPESKNWFIPVEKGGARYTAELGYYDQAKKWVSISHSGATLTPPDSLAEDTSVQFATIPSDVPFDQLLALVRAAIRSNVPLMEALQQLRATGAKHLPGPKDVSQPSWSPAQEQALAQVVRMDEVRRVWIGSLEITEILRRQLAQDMSSGVAGQFSLPSSLSLFSGSLSSPFGAAGQRGKGFWFMVNAELIIYGATEPDAKVTIGGRPIQLRPDGSFSFRFSLPDGEYDLPVVAVEAAGDDTRSAALRFQRTTKYGGEVGRHPQDPALRPPEVANVS